MQIILLDIQPQFYTRIQAELHWYAASQPDIVILPWETYISSYTNTWIVVHVNTMRVV